MAFDQFGEIAQTKHSLHHQTGVELPRARSEKDQAHLVRPGCRRFDRVPQEPAEIDDAVEIAPDIGDTEKPWLGQGNAGHGRNSDHLACVGEPDQPLRSGACQAKPRLFDLSGGLGREPRRQLLLKGAEIELAGACHR